MKKIIVLALLLSFVVNATALAGLGSKKAAYQGGTTKDKDFPGAKEGVEGTLNPTTGQAILVYEWEGGTGRFANATGAAVWLVHINPDQTFDVVAKGFLDF